MKTTRTWSAWRLSRPPALGVSKATRVPLLADVPTIAEQGVKGFESGTWQGLLAPASLPPAALARLTAEVTRIIRSPEVRERPVSQGAEVHTLIPADFKAWFERERQQWAAVVAKAGVMIDQGAGRSGGPRGCRSAALGGGPNCLRKPLAPGRSLAVAGLDLR